MKIADSIIVRILLLLCLAFGTSPAIAASLDTTPPQALVNLNPSSYTRGFVTVSVYGLDDTGIKAIYCRFKGQTQWQSSNSLCVLEAPTNLVVEFYAEDIAGNQSEIGTEDVCSIDQTAPVLDPATVQEQGGISNNVWTRLDDPNFTWTEAADPQITCGSGLTKAGSGLNEYSVYFGTNPQGTSNQLQFGNFYDPPALSESGVYYLRVRPEDYAGNQGSWTTLFTYKLDLDLPQVSAVTEPAQPDGKNTWFRINPVVRGVASDPTSSIVSLRAQFDGGVWENVDWISVSGDGRHRVSFEATDAAGNVASATAQVWVDRALPDFKLVLPFDAPSLNDWYLHDVTLRDQEELSAYDLSGIAALKYQVNGGGWSTTPPTISQSGVYPIDIDMSDNAGNQALGQITIQLDKDGPVLVAAIAERTGNAIYGVVKFVGTVTDPQSGVGGLYYQVDNSFWQPVIPIGETGAFRLNWDSREVPNGLHTIRFDARDGAGHSTIKTLTVETQNYTIYLPAITR